MKTTAILCLMLFSSWLPAQEEKVAGQVVPTMAEQDFRRQFRSLHLEMNRALWDKMLFNLAESHIEHAGLLGLSKGEVKTERRMLLEARKPLMKGKPRDSYRKFLTSTRYSSAMKRAERNFAGKHGKLVRRLEQAIEDQLQLDRMTDARQGMEILVQVDPGNQRFRRGKGRQIWQLLVTKDRQENHIDRLELGTQTWGKEIDIASLRGKVVVWRSVSL